jgi:PKD repeat protein
MNYDPAVLTFQGFTTTSVPGTWNFSVMATTAGRMIAGGYGPGFSLTDSSVLFMACFLYNGGSTPLAWYDADETSCEYADAVTLNPLYDIPQSEYYIDGIINGAPLAADFVADTTTPPKFMTVHFIDMSAGNPSTWDWTFVPPTCNYQDGTNPHSRHPHVEFTDGGTYTVSLVIHNFINSQTTTKVSYIRAGIHGLWTGDNSTDWNDETNWDNLLVPDGSTDIVIPGYRPHWPVFQGDLIIGNSCKSLVLEDPTAIITINGNLILN